MSQRATLRSRGRRRAGELAVLAVLLGLPAATRGQERDHHGNALTPGGDHVHTNPLIFESSPYLLQHAHNPVQWMPWGEAAFAKARAENKPIFLSIGYSTCHWCHVMARESFSDETVAAVLNDFFVPVKVDREERPDVDDVYMTAAQLIRGSGGWPLSAWLTPELEPFEVGTYYPRARFLQELDRLATAWLHDPSALRAQARRIAAGVARRLGATRQRRLIADTALTQAVTRLTRGEDVIHGGWGMPKFPRENTLLFLLDRWHRTGDRAALDAAVRALDGMLAGGIHDQVGGGFARYATDAQWLVPHFEKMLYNQAWLGRCYLEAYRATGDPRYRRAAEGTLEYVRRDMTAPAGGFYSAEDADSEGEEGLFYLWTPGELEAALGPEESALAARWFGVTALGNWAEHPGKTILTARQDPGAFAARHGMTRDELFGRVDRWRATLASVRAARVRPERDEKVLTDWNGMMIGTFARAGAALGDADHVRSAERAAEFILRALRDDEGHLQHAWIGGRASVPAFLDDHAALIDGLLELHDVTGGQRWADEAVRSYGSMRSQFRDPEDGVFARTGPRHERLLARAKDGYDGARPSGNALAAWDAVRLWRLTGEPAYREDADGILRAFAPNLERATGSAFLLRALDALENGLAGPIARHDGGVVSVRVAGGGRDAVAGAGLPLVLTLEIDQGWHVLGAATPPDGLKATSVTASGALALLDADWPPGDLTKLPYLDQPVRLFATRVEVPLLLTVAADARGPTVGWIDVACQPCNEDRCLAPATLRVEIPLVAAAATPDASTEEAGG